MADEKTDETTTQAESSEDGAVTLKLAEEEWNRAAFDPVIDGVEPITHDGTEVPKDKEHEVRTRARVAGVKIRKEG